MFLAVKDFAFYSISFFQKFDFNVRKMTVLLGDRTLLKILQFFGSGEGNPEDLKSEEFGMQSTQRLAISLEDLHFVCFQFTSESPFNVEACLVFSRV